MSCSGLVFGSCLVSDQVSVQFFALQIQLILSLPVNITTPLPLDEAYIVAELNNYRSLLEVIGAILLSPLKAA